MAINEKAQIDTDLMQRLAQLEEKQAEIQIHQQAAQELGQYGAEVVAAREQTLNAQLASYKKIQGFDHVVMNFATNQAGVTANANDTNGFSGMTYHAQQQIPFPEKAGGVWVNGKLNQSPDSKVSGNVGVNYVAPAGTVDLPGKDNRLDYVPIANVNVDIANNGQVSAKNINGLVGVVLKSHEDNGENHNINYTLAATGNSQALNGYVRASKQVDLSDGYSVTGYGSGSYGTEGKLNLGGGAQVNKNLGHGYGASVQADIGVADVAGKPDINAFVTGRITWGGAEQKSEIEQRLAATNPSALQVATATEQTAKSHSQESAARPNGHATSQAVNQLNEPEMQKQVAALIKQETYQQGMEKAYAFYSELKGNPASQQQFLAHIAENVAKVNPMYQDTADALKHIQISFENQDYLNKQAQNQQDSRS